MTIRLAFIGTGTCNSTPRSLPALALSDGHEVALVDCGGGAYHQLSRLSDDHFQYSAVSTVLLTHFHMDHVSGLADLIWGEMWDKRRRRTAPLTVVGPPGLKTFMHDRLFPFIGDYPCPFEVRTIEIQPGEKYDAPFCSVRSCRLTHDERSTGYLFRIGTMKLAVTGDTGYCENLEELLSESDIAVMEWSETHFDSVPYHISNADVERLIKRGALPRKIYITHMYPVQGQTFSEQIAGIYAFLGSMAERFVFPQDLDVIDIA